MIAPFILYILVAMLILAVIGFALDMINSRTRLPILSHAIDVILGVIFILAIEDLILAFIELFI